MCFTKYTGWAFWSSSPKKLGPPRKTLLSSICTNLNFFTRASLLRQRQEEEKLTAATDSLVFFKQLRRESLANSQVLYSYLSFWEYIVSFQIQYKIPSHPSYLLNVGRINIQGGQNALETTLVCLITSLRRKLYITTSNNLDLLLYQFLRWYQMWEYTLQLLTCQRWCEMMNYEQWSRRKPQKCSLSFLRLPPTRYIGHQRKLTYLTHQYLHLL